MASNVFMSRSQCLLVTAQIWPSHDLCSHRLVCFCHWTLSPMTLRRLEHPTSTDIKPRYLVSFSATTSSALSFRSIQDSAVDNASFFPGHAPFVLFLRTRR